jgi:hypothetical protein
VRFREIDALVRFVYFSNAQGADRDTAPSIFAEEDERVCGVEWAHNFLVCIVRVEVPATTTTICEVFGNWDP